MNEHEDVIRAYIVDGGLKVVQTADGPVMRPMVRAPALAALDALVGLLARKDEALRAAEAWILWCEDPARGLDVYPLEAIRAALGQA